MLPTILLAAAIAVPVDAVYPELDALYRDLHAHPELSLEEKETASKLAAKLREAGFEVATGVGGHGVVGVLRNGDGPTVMLRTDLDALPIREETGLPYASVREGVMHACGHDVHMTSWVGAATLLARMRDRWKGTLVMVGQPAEEIGRGARSMLEDGLFSKFPRPEFALALHAKAELPAGTVGWIAGPALASADSVDVVFRGRGGHGASPHRTIDPVVIGARFVTAVQTLVSRETDPLDPAVVTVGSFHAGTKHNIIPDVARLQMTVRAYREDVRRSLLAGIARIARAEAAAARAPEPEVVVADGIGPTVNDPALARRLAQRLSAALGEGRVVEVPPATVAEDFSEFGRAGVPAVLLWLGTADPARLRDAFSRGEALPGLHTSTFAPDREATLRTGVETLVVAALELLR